MARDLVRAFEENDLLTYASAISFQILTAIVPFFLFVLALAGLLHLQGVWDKDFAPHLQVTVSRTVFTVISGSVHRVFFSRTVVWATVGGALAVWQISGAVRAVMGALDKIYCAEMDRPFLRRMLISFALSIAVGASLVLFALSVRYAPFFISLRHRGAMLGTIGFLVRWGVGLGCLLVATGLLVHFAPATPQPWRWVTAGSMMVIGAWSITSLLFAIYLSSIASYDSIFGSLAVFVALTAYIYLSATAFLLGAQLDAMIRAEVKGTAAGASHGSQRCE